MCDEFPWNLLGHFHDIIAVDCEGNVYVAVSFQTLALQVQIRN